MNIPLPIVIFSAAALITLLAALIQPYVVQRLTLERTFIAPFREWAARMTSPLNELLFWLEYHNRQQSPRNRYFQIGSNFFEVHDVMAQADKSGWAPYLSRKGYRKQVDAFRFLVEETYHNLKVKSGRYYDGLTNEQRKSAPNCITVGRAVEKSLQKPAAKQTLRDYLRVVKKYIPRS
ncbi:hypothetical protein HY441_00870 [Candidatus Microgenomates bacterium]|nr:hypothetical protein [Candidatus Microgenomates bacterium]